MANNYAYFTGDASRWDDATEAIWGSHNFCPLLTQFQVSKITSLGLSTISWAEAWGDPKRPRFGIAYLLPAQEVEEERRFGLVVVWVHPSQPLLPSLEEVTRKLTLLINMKEDWPYAFMWVCKDSQHIPLSDAGHISIMGDGAPSRSTCGHLSQQGVYQLLQVGSEVAYPEGLNMVPLPKLPI